MSKYTYDQNGNAYQLRGGKHSCPSCGKRTLQLYIGADGEPINDHVGKCDRHYNCGYDYPPKAYYADHPEELPPSKDGKARHYEKEPERPVIPIPARYVEASLIPAAANGMTTFTDYLLKMWPADNVKRVIDLYFLGRTKHGAVIFWQIDETGTVREGKVMKYMQNGGRDKASWATGESYWIYSLLEQRGEMPANTKSIKCLFGQHLLRDAGHNTQVFITESDKNAIAGALMHPEGVWLAVGSSQEMGKVWKIRNLLSQCRSVVFVPDADAAQDWEEQVARFNLPNAAVNRFCAGHADGYDIADFMLYVWLEEGTVRTRKKSATDSDKSIATIGDWLSYANERKIDPRRVFTTISGGNVSIEVRSEKWLKRKLELESIEYF